MKPDRITINPARMNGQPCIRDLRLTVRRVVELLATHPNREELYHDFPELETDQSASPSRHWRAGKILME